MGAVRSDDDSTCQGAVVEDESPRDTAQRAHPMAMHHGARVDRGFDESGVEHLPRHHVGRPRHGARDRPRPSTQL
jgi:hypothetical protein